MKTFLRRAGIGLGVLLLLALLGIWRWQVSLGPTLRDRLVRDLPDSLGVAVEIGAIELNLLGGWAEVREVRIGNPEGFASPDLFRSGSFSVDYSPLSFLGGSPRVREIALRGPDLTWETLEGRGSNWKAMLDRSKRTSPSKETPVEPGDTRPTRPRGRGLDVLIERIRVEDAVLRLAGGAPGTASPPVKLPSFDILRPGRDDGDSGLTILFKVMGALAVGMQNAVSNAAPAQVLSP